VTRHLIVIGAQRSGTTYLASVLEAHPDIAMARPIRPEPKVFLRAEDASRGVDWYRSTYFGHVTTEQVLGEKSTSYIEHPEAAARMARLLGSVQVIVMLRDPVARAVSNWQFSVAHGVEERSLHQAMTDPLEVARPWDPRLTSVSPFAYLQRGRYADYLDPWREQFPGTTHIRFFEELVGNEAQVVDLYAALGVDPGFRPPMVEQRVNQSPDAAPELDPGLERRLRGYFAASDTRLREGMGRPLPWDDAAAQPA
jgi:LPS sulfotransferase NodH